jgi:hypothetical protein
VHLGRGAAGCCLSAEEHDELAREHVAVARYWRTLGERGNAKRETSLAKIHRQAAVIKRACVAQALERRLIRLIAEERASLTDVDHDRRLVGRGEAALGSRGE